MPIGTRRAAGGARLRLALRTCGKRRKNGHLLDGCGRRAAPPAPGGQTDPGREHPQEDVRQVTPGSIGHRDDAHEKHGADGRERDQRHGDPADTEGVLPGQIDGAAAHTAK